MKGEQLKGDKYGGVSADSIYFGPPNSKEGGPWDYATLTIINDAFGKKGNTVYIWKNMNFGKGLGSRSSDPQMVYWSVGKFGGNGDVPYEIYCTLCKKE